MPVRDVSETRLLESIIQQVEDENRNAVKKDLRKTKAPHQITYKSPPIRVENSYHNPETLNDNRKPSIDEVGGYILRQDIHHDEPSYILAESKPNHFV